MQKYEYTHHLPYGVRSSLCNLLDADQSWRNLGGKLGLDATQLSLLGQAYMRLNGSPANELLNRLDSSNVRIRDLARCLSELNNWRAVELLQPFENNNGASNGVNSTCDSITTNNKQSTLTTPTPSFIDCEALDAFGLNGLQADDSLMMLQMISQNPAKETQQILPITNINTTSWVLNHEVEPATRNDATQPTLPIKSVCHKEQQQQQQQQQKTPLSFFNSSRDRQQEDKIRQACTSSKHRTSLTDCEVVNQLRLIMQINYKELKVASDNFSDINIIGNGGFASVYRGNLKGTEVAIKRLKCNLVDQALNELTIMNSYRIDNILPIYGISIDGPEACLVYQYMSNGSLEDRLACKGGSPPLTWKQRALIGEGLAKSLYYLHTLRDKPLVHGDVKSANVLLDAQMVPKLGDFGLARQVFKGIKGKEMLTHCTVSSINGTSVYLPAEYLRHRILSPAVDVYSYGIVLLEMGTGKRAYDGKRLLIDRVQDEFSSVSSGQIDATLKDNRLDDDSSQVGLKIWFELMISLGLECAHRIKKKRPDMGQVLAKYSTFWKENEDNIVKTPNKNDQYNQKLAQQIPMRPTQPLLNNNKMPQQQQHQIINGNHLTRQQPSDQTNLCNQSAQQEQQPKCDPIATNRQIQNQNQIMPIANQDFNPQQTLYQQANGNQQFSQLPQLQLTNQYNHNINNYDLKQNQVQYMQPIDENIAYVNPQVGPMQQQEQQFIPFDSSIMLIEETPNYNRNRNQNHQNQHQLNIDNGMNNYGPQYTTNDGFNKQNELQYQNQQQQQQNHQQNQQQSNHNNNQQTGNQVDAMIPLLTELGIDGQQSD